MDMDKTFWNYEQREEFNYHEFFLKIRNLTITTVPTIKRRRKKPQLDLYLKEFKLNSK